MDGAHVPQEKVPGGSEDWKMGYMKMKCSINAF